MLHTSQREPELLSPDLSACEHENIHVPGAIEPNGCMIVVSQPDLVLLQVSSNTFSMLGISPETLLGMNLRELFAQKDVEQFATGFSHDGSRRYIGGVHTSHSETAFDCLAHEHQGLLIIELEPSLLSSTTITGSDIYASLTDAVAELDSAQRLPELCQRMAVRIRHITGFDRVMVYRFLKDDSGSVIAEDRRDDLIPYLGLRYPASDIPAQARRLYLRNTLRLKADVNAKRATLMPAVNPFSGGPLDMTFCILRAMSPVHDEYLRNMGVAASMSISVVRDGRLWGLIACHHTQPRLVPHTTRITCEVLARVFSSHIAAAEVEDQRVHAAALRELTSRIALRLRTNPEVISTLTETQESIRNAIGAQGCAFCIKGEIGLFGITPARAEVKMLAAWLGTNQQEHVFATERLASVCPQSEEFVQPVSGLLSVRIALGGSDFILWFRPSIVQVITWAGDPGKPAEVTEAGRRIGPRRSFELWQQTVGDSAEPWAESDQEFASGLRPILAEAMLMQLTEEMFRLNLELTRSNVELDSFAYAASHDLQQPARTIRAYAQLLARSAGPDLTSESRGFLTTIEASAGRMGNLITGLLSYSQLGGASLNESKPVNLEEVVRWVLTNLEEAIAGSGASITHDVLPFVAGDPNHMVQLIQNLIDNGIKYRRPDARPSIHLSAQLQGEFVEICVVDNGEGFDPEHSDKIFGAFKRLHGADVPGNGIGLATCRRIVEIHGGTIRAESRGKNCGATFRFTLPLANVQRTSAKQGKR